MTAITHKTTHVADAKTRLAYQFHGKVALESLLDSLVQQIQVNEDTSYDLLQQRTFAFAEGAQLDGVGAVIGEQRGGKDDATYRLYIAVRVLINISTGTVENLLGVLSILSPESLFKITSPGAMTLRIQNLTPSTEDHESYVDLVSQARAAGVNVTYEYSTETALTFDDAGIGFDGAGSLGYVLQA